MHTRRSFITKFTHLGIILFISLSILVMSVLTWQKYQVRQRYLHLIQLTEPYQHAVHRCFAHTHALLMCQAGQHGIPSNIRIKDHHPRIQRLTVDSGKIIVVPRHKNGITEHDTYVLTPCLRNHQLAWRTSGGGVENGYAS